jgi:CRISPR-associated endonuclease/helicase Cas3
MVTKPPLAHSPRQGIPAQPYSEHVTNVCRHATRNARRASAFYTGDRDAFVGWVEAAALYHDLGKLDKENQAILEADSRQPLPIAHDDAGVAELEKLGRREEVGLASAHHGGLFSQRDELGKQGRPFRQLEKRTPGGESVADHVDRELECYERVHAEANCPALHQVEPSRLHGCGFTRRIALSCLVDADHGDTARHYAAEVVVSEAHPRWEERMAALQHYVDGLETGKSEQERRRNYLRRGLYEACRDAALKPPIRTCDSPVGTGKTTAVMAHLLRVAAERKPSLRHIIVVPPYTNIISQSVAVYRKALTLPGERPEDVVAEHHHRADFADLELRQLATLWKAPIIVTTAVQFFETLGSHHPEALRKLHELPGSAVFVDEMHAAIPSHLWPQMWRWLETWTRDWGGHLVLASGSLPRFWELPEYRDAIREKTELAMPAVPDLVTDDPLRSDLKKTEQRRIQYRRRSEAAEALDCDGVIEFVVQKKPGPRLLIVNTVHTAGVIAQKMRQSGHNVLHLSTALAPVHRDLIVERVKLRLRSGMDNWTLVATSCVEAGMDFSFRQGFRERASTASLIQIGGRINRGHELEHTSAEVWDLLLRDEEFRPNPAVSISRQALDRFTLEDLNGMHPAKLATRAMKLEWTSGAEERAKQLIKDEKGMEYPSVSRQCRVIDTDTRTVIIDPSLAEAVRNGEAVSRVELVRYSVQLWASRIDKLALEPLAFRNPSLNAGLYYWPYEYDGDFLGYMKGVLKLEEFISSGGAVI